MNFSGVVKRIIDLAEQTTTSDTDCIPIGGTTLKRITIANLRKALGIDSLYEKNDDLSNSISLLNSNMNKIIRKSISGITSTSTKNLVELGVITTAGSYVVFITNTGVTVQNTASAYFVRYGASNINGVTPIVEGSSTYAPRVDSSGVVTRNTSDQQYVMGFLAIKID